LGNLNINKYLITIILDEGMHLKELNAPIITRNNDGSSDWLCWVVLRGLGFKFCMCLLRGIREQDSKLPYQSIV